MTKPNTYNPDVLSCLANLSSDEVFTPPSIANQMLDLLPAELWSNSNATFLDPACKTGVFLREITKRLDKGLEQQFPDRQARLNHILVRQVFGLAITELTGMISRRSVYCSKSANGKYSICNEFQNDQGNIRFARLEHTWDDDRCIYCGANKSAYDRSDELESYAYPFLHTENPETLFNMKFDVVVGNPPYQLGSDGGTRDIPIYNRFVDQARKLNPSHLVMIIPSRWMASGLGLKEFRSSMLNDKRLSQLVDMPVASEVFPGVEIKGGVCYFLWQKDHYGPCEVTLSRNGQSHGPEKRDLSEFDVLVRDARSVEILRKVLAHEEVPINEILSADKEFGMTSNFSEFVETPFPDAIPLYYIRNGKRAIGYIARDRIMKSANLADTWKVLVPKAGSDGGQRIPDPVIGTTLIAPSPSVCTQSYLFFYVDSLQAANSIAAYLSTRFARFLISLRKITQDATWATYTWVPTQAWDRTWTDAELYRKYDLSGEEVSHIERMIARMGNNGAD
jgi:site-specific DNA-methyltransferase (adenine-specific)